VINCRESPLIVDDQSVVIFIFVFDLGAGHMLIFVAVTAYNDSAQKRREEQCLEHDGSEG